MKATMTIDLDVNSTGLIVAEIISQLGWMDWNSLLKVRDQCRELTKPTREAAQEKYKRKAE